MDLLRGAATWPGLNAALNKGHMRWKLGYSGCRFRTIPAETPRGKRDGIYD